jgi:hypothetical protein
MKSIKEKSEEYGLQYPVIHYDADGNTYDDVDKPSMDFEAGANYVIDAIQSCIDRHEDGCLALEAITLTIDKLKR